MSLRTPKESQDSPFKSNVTEPALSKEEFEQANKDLNDQSYVKKYKKLERTFADPIHNNQVFSLHSFVPSKGALPDEDGIYGMIKFRGTYATVEEANERAEWLIRNVDSYNSILTGYVGRPFPLVGNNEKFVTETNEVDLNKKTSDVVSEDLKQKRRDDKKAMAEIKEKEKRLLDDVREDKKADPYEDYTQLRVKKSQLVFTYNETLKKMKQMITSLKATDIEINKMEEEDSDYKEQYMERYMTARKEAGIPDDQVDSFMKYLNNNLPWEQQLDYIITEEESSS